MKTLTLILFFLFLSALSCKKDEPEPIIDYYNNYYIKGAVYDSTNGNIVSGVHIYFAYQEWLYCTYRHLIKYSSPMTTDQNGIFRGHISWPSGNGDPPNSLYYPPSIMLEAHLGVGLSDTLAGCYLFKFGDLKLNDTLQTNFYLKSAGYLSLNLVDTSSTSDIQLWFGTNYDYAYPFVANGDTTFLKKLIGNSKAYISYLGFTDTVYVAEKDTTVWTIYY